MGDLRQKPMRRKSLKAVDRDQRLAEVKRVVLARSGGRCEGCGDREAALDLAHVAGRGHLLRAELADTPEMTTALCRECHRKVDRHLDPDLRRDLQDACRERILDTNWDLVLIGECLDAIRTLYVHAERNAG